MSDKEKKAYGVASLLIVGMFLFPPWEQVRGTGRVHHDMGYSLITTPPRLSTINYGRLGVQILAVAVAAFGIAKLTK